LSEDRKIPVGEVGCTICNKSIYRIFVEHIQSHLDGEKPKSKDDVKTSKKIRKVANDLEDAFSWSDTEDQFNYWYSVQKKIMALAEKYEVNGD